MSIMEYWPSRKNIVQCIRNEAEELEDHVPVSYTHLDVYKRQLQKSEERVGTSDWLL